MTMNEIFSTRFSFHPYFNIIKGFTDLFYKCAISNPSNKNTKYQTKGLNFHFSNDDRINACAFIQDNFDNIVVNTGTVSALYRYFFSAFSSNEIFLNIGNVSDEDPLCNPARRTMAEYVSFFAMIYIVTHELGHLLDGHLHLINNLYGVSNIEMILKKSIFNLSQGQLTDYARDRRTLEMDADAYAASASIAILVNNLNQSSNDIRSILKDPFQIFELWTFAVHSFFMILELEVPSNFSLENFYLPNNARETLNLSAAWNTLDFMISQKQFVCSPKEYNQIKEYFYSGIAIAENFMNTHKRQNFCYKRELLTDAIHSDECDLVLKHWDSSLRPRLEKYARAKLYQSN